MVSDVIGSVCEKDSLDFRDDKSFFDQDLIKTIEDAWENKIDASDPKVHSAVKLVSKCINDGTVRIAEKINDCWVTNQWAKKTILLVFKLNQVDIISGSPANSFWFDKVPLKFQGWTLDDFKQHKIRTVPGSLVRYPAYIGKNVVLMPSYINLGCYIGDNTMIDIGASLGACAQIGKNCHISGNALIGGVVEPIGERPVIIEDGCFIGASSSITEGVIVKEGSVIASGVHITASTKIIDRQTGNITYGVVPEYSVVVSGSFIDSEKLSIYCVVIVKKVDKQTRDKTSINEILRKI